MTGSRSRRLAIDLIPAALAIGYGFIEPMMFFFFVPIGTVLLIWAAYRFWAKPA